jgi:hypothetical protein
MSDLPRPPAVSGRLLDARLHLLDRQVLDVGGEPVMAVDDLELEDLEPGRTLPPEAPTISNLIGGVLLSSRVFQGRSPRSRMYRIQWRHVTEVDVALHLAVDDDELDVGWPERWLRAHVIGHIPGGRRAGD